MSDMTHQLTIDILNHIKTNEGSINTSSVCQNQEYCFPRNHATYACVLVIHSPASVCHLPL